MDSSREAELQARLEKVEASIAALQRSMEALLAERARPVAAGSSNAPAQPVASGPATRREWSFAQFRNTQSRPNVADDFAETLSSWFSSRSPEWWLSRLGMAFVVLAVLLLYNYAIDEGWITPPVRVFAGAVLGAFLLRLAIRTPRPPERLEPTDLGMRDLLFGGALAVWYVTAYAAAVWYQIISIPVARLVFFVVAIISAWVALREKREIFALVAIVAGFATPFILPAPTRSAAELSLYLGLVGAVGLAIYLMRGWQSIVWITFVGFWLCIVGTLNGVPRNLVQRSPALSVLLVLATAAFVRAPLLRRELLLLGSDRYTASVVTSGMRRLMEGLDSLSEALGGGKSEPDSLVFWIPPLISPVLAVGFLEAVWPSMPKELWGLVLLLLGAAAFGVARRFAKADPETLHVAATAASLWTVLSIGRLVFSPESIPLGAFVATIIMLSGARRFAGPRTVAKATIAIALTAIVGHELGFAEVGLIHVRWVLSGVATIGCAGLIAQALYADPSERLQGLVLAIAAYLSTLVLLWRMLEPVWPPLVTTSYALLGATLLVMSRRLGTSIMLRRLGAVTMLVVVARLLLVDLSSVETIWRVVLFLGCGAGFLYTGYRLQPASSEEK